MQLTKLSIAIASLGVIGLAMSAQASAAIATAASGTGSLILAVTDTVTGVTFYQDLGRTTAQMSPTTNASFTKDVSTDANYTALLAQAGSHQLDFAVIGGSYSSSVPALNTYLTTSGTSVYGPTTQSNLNLRNFSLIDQNVIGPLNGDIGSAGGSFYVDPNSTTAGVNTFPGYTSASGLWNWNGKAALNTIAAVGTTASNFFYLAGSGTSGKATPTLEGTMTFNAGVLTFTSSNASAVPLPAAVWLFGSGLAGLVGVGRRRRSAV